VPYWNAYVAITQMHGQGNKRDKNDRVTAKLAGLHYYQLSLPPPTPPKGSFDAAAAKRGQQVFNGKASRCTRRKRSASMIFTRSDPQPGCT
jgi:hypothetical protein